MLEPCGTFTSIFSESLTQFKDIFSKYCTPAPGHALDAAFLTEEGLDRWAQDTNGAPFTQETKEELRQFMDVTEEGHLT